MRYLLLLIPLLLAGGLKAQEKHAYDSLLNLFGADVRAGGTGRLEIHYKQIAANRFSYQVKAGFDNSGLQSADIKASPTYYGNRNYITGNVDAYTMKLGWIPVKKMQDPRAMFFIATNVCMAYAEYDLSLWTKDALYGPQEEHRHASKFLVGAELEMLLAVRLFPRAYMNLGLMGGIKPQNALFTDLIPGNEYGTIIPGQSSSDKDAYLNALIGLSFNLHGE